MSAVALLQHLGDLHAVENVLVAVVALGPFAVLAVVGWRQRRGVDPGLEAGPPGEQGPVD